MTSSHNPRSVTDIDIKLASKIRKMRIKHGYTQTEMAQRFGVTYQQWQKYEAGKNRMTASRLFKISRLLNFSLDRFCEEIEEMKDTP